MKTNLAGAFAVALAATAEMAAAPPVVAATALVDFETAPSIATGPSRGDHACLNTELASISGALLRCGSAIGAESTAAGRWC